jgi:hypothetical protein
MRYTYHLYLDRVPLPIPDAPESVTLDSGRALRSADVGGKLEYRCAQLDPAGNRYPFWPIPNPRNAGTLRQRGQAIMAQYSIQQSVPGAEGGTRVASAQTLRSYFETADQQRRALDAVAREGWLDPGGNRLLYEASQRAFDPSSSGDEAFRAFEEIYKELKGPNWQVFRSSKKNVNYWKSRQVFEAIRREFSEFSWRGSVNLLNFPQSGTGLRMESGLASMRAIKPNKHYPLMTVSKFLHFYNPGLFPIYDNAVIGEKVFSRFRDDFRDFCLAANIPYEIAMKDDAGKFLHYYTLWASSLLSAAHGSFMQVFADWLDKDPGSRSPERRFDPGTLYATAFEFTAIGAAMESQITRRELSESLA